MLDSLAIEVLSLPEGSQSNSFSFVSNLSLYQLAVGLRKFYSLADAIGKTVSNAGRDSFCSSK